jgi:hypothetical protein
MPRESGASSIPGIRGQNRSGTVYWHDVLDYPLEPVIGRRDAPTRWRTMTTLDTAAVQFNENRA